MNQDTIRLLILNDSRTEAERLTSMLQNAGCSLRAQHVESLDALSKLLQEKVWDLMIALDTTKTVSPIEAIKHIRRLNKDITLILQTENEGSHYSVDAMKMGACDAIRLDEDQHLLQVIDREMKNRVEREKRRYAERRYAEISRHNQQLLDSSRDAIAFIQDGMFLYANDSFAELLGHEHRDDLECLPVIDIIQDSDHDKLKRFLKEFTLKGSDVDGSKLTVNAILANEKTCSLTLEVRKSTYDEETCIQFIVRSSNIKTGNTPVNNTNTDELEAQLEIIKNQDVATGLFNKAYFLDKLNSTINKAVDKEYNSALLHIGIDNFQEIVTQKVGFGSTDLVLATIASFTQELLKDTDTLCRFADDTFMLIAPKINAYKAQERADELGNKLRDFIVDIDGTTLRFNYHIGIAIINETSTNTDIPIDHTIKALDLARQSWKKDATTVARIYEPEIVKDENQDIVHQVTNALRDSNFKLLFQPILSLRGSDKEHYEVLLRLQDNNGEEISPTEFLSVAEKIHLTTKVDRWVILESIKILSNHRKKGNNTRLIINLSRDSLIDTTLAPWLSVAFKAADLPSDAVIFQLKERDINDHLNVASEFSQKVKKLGADCSITHFGCAMNPFKALEKIHASYIKVDGSFTQDLQKNSEGAQVLNELVSELHQMDKITVVPFVENAAVLSKLWQSGVHYIQGYYLQGPTTAMDYDFDMES